MKGFFKKYGRTILLILPTILIGTYFWFIFEGGFPAGDNLEKSHWLGFWAGFLSFAGTVFLGAVSLWQNDKANEINKQNQQDAKEMAQITLQNELIKNKNAMILDGAQQLAYRVSEVNKQLVNILTVNNPHPDEDDRKSLRYISKLFEPIITDITFLSEIEMQNFIPLFYDNEYIVLKENRPKIQKTLINTSNSIKKYQEQLALLENKGDTSVELKIPINIPQDSVNAIIAFFTKEITDIRTYSNYNIKENTND